jgi:hypothetical protein
MVQRYMRDNGHVLTIYVNFMVKCVCVCVCVCVLYGGKGSSPVEYPVKGSDFSSEI